MAKVQYLMTGHSRDDENGQSTWYPPVIIPKEASAPTCTKPMCEEGGKFVPAGVKPLCKDEDGPACEEDFNVAAVVGQLLYLSGHTRPDIAYAVNCCARYMFCARRSHELALKQIGRYLRRTRTKGLVLTPSENLLAIDAFPDADFAGMCGVERPDDPACVKSRTGFVINVANCPVLWMSKLQRQRYLPWKLRSPLWLLPDLDPSWILRRQRKRDQRRPKT